MHIEKNVTDSLLRTLTNAQGTKEDRLEVRLELKAEGRMPSLHPQEDGLDAKQKVKFKWADAPWVWSKEEYKSFKEVIRGVRTPSSYGASLRKKFKDERIMGLKTHDYHHILHHFLPIGIKGTFKKHHGLKQTIYMLSGLFRWICLPEIKVDEIPNMKREATEVMCLLEIHFPPTIFDMQVHLIIHLVDEVELCGPVQARWMYFIERYMKELTDFVRQKKYPEGSMVARYHLKETIYFCSEYLSALDPKGSIVWKIPQTTKEADQVLAHSHTIIKMDKDLYNEVQTYILKNTEEMRVWEVHYNIENDIRKERRIKWMTEKWGGP